MGITLLLNCDFLFSLGLMLRGFFFAVMILGFGGFLDFRGSCLGCDLRGLRGNLVTLLLLAVLRLFALCGVGACLVQKVEVDKLIASTNEGAWRFLLSMPNTNISDSRRRDAKRVKSLSDETMQKASEAFLIQEIHRVDDEGGIR